MIRIGWNHSIPLANISRLEKDATGKRLYAFTGDGQLWRIVARGRFGLAYRSIRRFVTFPIIREIDGVEYYAPPLEEMGILP